MAAALRIGLKLSIHPWYSIILFPFFSPCSLDPWNREETCFVSLLCCHPPQYMITTRICATSKKQNNNNTTNADPGGPTSVMHDLDQGGRAGASMSRRVSSQSSLGCTYQAITELFPALSHHVEHVYMQSAEVTALILRTSAQIGAFAIGSHSCYRRTDITSLHGLARLQHRQD